MGGNNEFFENFEGNKYLKKLPSMQRVKKERTQEPTITDCRRSAKSAKCCLKHREKLIRSLPDRIGTVWATRGRHTKF